MAAVASMTGYAAGSAATPRVTVSVELKSVNARFLELGIRLPDELRALEASARELLGSRLARGKVDVRVTLTRDPAASDTRVNRAALTRLAAVAAEAQAVVQVAGALSLADILRWPGVIESSDDDIEQLREPFTRALDQALELLTQTRLREGAALRAALLERCDGIDRILADLRAQVPAILAMLGRKLQERLSQALVPALSGSGNLSREEVNDRIRQEVTLYGRRADVDEELQRLGTHVVEVRRVLGAGGAVGRRLDFLMQELNREANTVGSKASAIEMTNAAVELKLLIDQMREQIQNLE
ncbi:MAG TPA: YicC/YloC family endoribonuclease [Burkholderiaceae bacterium]|nr:YicC/YloC family endoribonuclease [Burkholderiaceae bacterium]